LKQLRVHCFRIERKAVGNSPQRSGFEEKHGGTHSGRQQSSKHFLRRFDKTRRKTWCKKESGLEEEKEKLEKTQQLKSQNPQHHSPCKRPTTNTAADKTKTAYLVKHKKESGLEEIENKNSN
jgi:phage repressor protein C with HTH and peptisase S24 domain